MNGFTGLILAAGKGTRMGSDTPKVLHELDGVPMVIRVLGALEKAGATRTVVIIGHKGELVQSTLENRAVEFAWQHNPQGTGHAVLQALENLPESGPVIIAPGDAPLIPSDAYEKLVANFNEGNQLVVSTVRMMDPTDYGRLVRENVTSGRLLRIVEERDCTPEEKAIKEVNLSLYCVDAKLLRELVPQIKLNERKNEYYLTDIVEMAAAKGASISTVEFTNPDIYMGVNDRWSLLLAEKALRIERLKLHVNRGVILKDIDTIFIGEEVEIGEGTIIEPCTTLTGETVIGRNCRIGPYTIIDDSKVGNEALIYLSRISEAVIGPEAKIGPFANLRPGANLGAKVKIGNFVEVKKSKLDNGVSVSHLSYIGDAQIGSNSNIGAGTITCNYDGYRKHQTTIGRDSFIGSNSTLVAPITIGEGAFVAAGSVITKDVPPAALGLGRARQEVKEEWATQWHNKNIKK